MRILLSEGSGLTSRQVAGRLDELGHEVEVLSSATICLARFTRHVRAIHLVPHFGADPFAWLDAAQRIARERGADLLFPTQEQVTILSARQARLTVPTTAPPFASLRRVQDKVSSFRTLASIGIPQPETIVLACARDLARVMAFPVFIKRPISTASSGVRRISSPDELAAAARGFGLGTTELLLQETASGPLAMVQAVASHGRLIAHHANLRLREGVGGGASLKRSIILPGIAGLLTRLVAALHWHGGLSMDLIMTPNGPVVIDVNPRLVEPANAHRAGVDLVGAMLDAARGDAAIQPAGRAGVLTRQTLLAVLGAAERHGTRRAVLRESLRAILASGGFAGSAEELTPIGGDPLAAVPVAAALAATLLRPSLWRLFYRGAVGSYAVTQDAWEKIAAAADR